MSLQEHSERAGREVGAARCHILTVSDTRQADNDDSGRAAAGLIEAGGHEVADRRIVPNDKGAIVEAARAAIAGGADLVLALGGTGISKRDVTVEALRELMTRELPGFGELFRSLSAREIGSATILSRATLGVTAEGRLVAATPGSPAAVHIALRDVLVPQLRHLLREIRK
jgi:molybdenum cofactor biosynthesis protein B